MSTSDETSIRIENLSPLRKNKSSTEEDRVWDSKWGIWGGSRYSGVICMIISSVSYSFMGLFVKLLSVSGVLSSETVMCRCIVVAILAGVGLKRMGHPLLGSPKVKQLVLARAVVGYFALSTYFYSVQHSSVTIAGCDSAQLHNAHLHSHFGSSFAE